MRATISVIIPSSGRETLTQCLHALQRQTYPADEILVIQDTEKMGAGFVRNKGISQSTGDLLAFTDDDCIPPDNWLENFVSVMDQFDADVVGGTMRESDPFLNAIRMRHSFPSVVQLDLTGLVGNTANIVYKRSVLEKILKRDGFIYKKLGEDIDLIWRLQQQGAKIVYTPNRVLHLRKVTSVQYLKRQFQRGITIASLYKTSRSVQSEVTMQSSLLWEQNKSKRKVAWWKIMWMKIVGPFDFESFSSIHDFLVFWIGEKVQGVGFLVGLFIKDRAG